MVTAFESALLLTWPLLVNRKRRATVVVTIALLVILAGIVGRSVFVTPWSELT